MSEKFIIVAATTTTVLLLVVAVVLLHYYYYYYYYYSTTTRSSSATTTTISFRLLSQIFHKSYLRLCFLFSAPFNSSPLDYGWTAVIPYMPIGTQTMRFWKKEEKGMKNLLFSVPYLRSEIMFDGHSTHWFGSVFNSLLY